MSVGLSRTDGEACTYNMVQGLGVRVEGYILDP